MLAQQKIGMVTIFSISSRIVIGSQIVMLGGNPVILACLLANQHMGGIKLSYAEFILA